MHRPLSVSVLLVALLLALTGCFRFEMELTVTENDTLTGSMVTAMNIEALEHMATFGGASSTDPRAIWEEMGAGGAIDLPPGAHREPYEQDDFIGDRVVFSETPISEMSTTMGDDGDFTLVRDGDTYVFEMVFELDDPSAGEFDDLVGDTEMFSVLYGKPEMIVSITFPGEVIETNGEVDGTTVSWNRDLFSAGASEPMQATANASGGAVPGGGGNGPEGGPEEKTETNVSSSSDNDESASTAAVVTSVGLGVGVLLLALTGMGLGVTRILRG